MASTDNNDSDTETLDAGGGVAPPVALTAALDDAERQELDKFRAEQAAAAAEAKKAGDEADAIAAATSGHPTTITINGIDYPARPVVPGALQLAMANISKGLMSAMSRASHANLASETDARELLETNPDLAAALMEPQVDKTLTYLEIARAVIRPGALEQFEARFAGDCPDDEIAQLSDVAEAVEAFLAGGDGADAPKQ